MNEMRSLPGRMAVQAAEAAGVLRALSHEGRLQVLCHLIEDGEVAAGELTRRVGLSQSALSQHLALLRSEGLVETRREAQAVFYRIADTKVARLLAALHDIYCSDQSETDPSND